MILLLAALAAAASIAQPHLVDQDGHRFTLAALRGRPAAVTFVSAHCADACPLIDAQFSAAAVRLSRERSPMRLLTITLDPERDSLADMAAIARTFGADPRRWIVAGGTPGDVHAVMRAFGVIAQRGPDGYATAHSTAVYILDARGVLRKAVLPSGDFASQIAEEAREISTEGAR